MYRTIEGKVIVEGNEYITYGIAYDDLLCIDDISSNKYEIVSLVNLCNMGELDPIHLNDIVEDFLANN